MVESEFGQASLMGRKLGNYDVRALIGCGAMGAVYRAQDVVLNRPVALKVMLGSLARNPEQVRRFQREAQAAAPLIHQNIVRIYEAGVRSGTPFIAMEYVEGEAFDRFLDRTGPLPWRHALELADQVAQGLACAHAHGVVHRDVKPANILLDKQGRVRLTDFGIAKVRDRSSGMTDHGQFIGTPEYMSPEQCSGVSEIGPPSDLFSLGVTLYRMIGGTLPFHGGSTAALIAGITLDTPVRLNKLLVDVPDDVARLVAHLLEKAPERRPESAAALSEMIGRLLSNDGGSSAMPDALSAFIREQAKPRGDSHPSPAPRDKPRAAQPRFRRQRAVKYEPISGGAKAAAAALAAVSIAAAAYWNVLARPVAVEAAPLLERAVFVQSQPGVFVHALPEDWAVDGISWDSRESQVLVRLAGRGGTAWSGGEGWLVVNPDTGEVTVPRAPRSPATDPEFAAYGARQPRVQAAGGSFALAAAWGEPGQVALLRQPLSLLTPASEPLAVLTAETWGTRGAWDDPGIETAAFLLPRSAGAYVVRPAGSGGAAFAAVDSNGTLNTLYSETRTVMGGSVQLSPDGGALWYLCREAAGRRILSRLAPLSAGAASINIVDSSGLGETYSIAPEGSLAAVETRTEIALYSADGSLIHDGLAGGTLHPQAWHPSGRFFLVARRGELLAQEAAPPYRATVAARFESTNPSHAAVSPGGRWAAVVLEHDNIAEIAFIDLGSLMFAAGASA
ncbi:MAG: protein kinase [Candidatus Hydrogenedens sp.]|nr:protein kinase [Candidatus Hydrogenedens sp.]